MKYLLITFCSAFFFSVGFSQTSQPIDSAAGFPEEAHRAYLQGIQLDKAEMEAYLLVLRRKFIREIYYPQGSTPAQKTTGSFINSFPCPNENFELSTPGVYSSGGAITGWSLTSGSNNGMCSSVSWASGSQAFSLAATPISTLVSLGSLGNSPLGGSVIAVLNNTNSWNYKITRLSQTFPVTTGVPFFNYAVAAILSDGGPSHNCCEASAYQVLFYDCNNNLISCAPSRSISSCQSHTTAFSFDGNNRYHNWQTHSVDLTAYINTCVRVDVIANDCSFGGHFGTVFFDAECGSGPVPGSIGTYTTSFCQGSNVASIQAPLIQNSYSWTAPSPYVISSTQATSALITINNPTAGAVFTLNVLSNLGCNSTQTIALGYSQIGAGYSNTLVSCHPGATGAATIFPTGSAGGYTYTWFNSTNSVVGTGSVISNVPPGIYTVSLSATPACGTATSSVVVPAFTSSFVLSGPSSYSLCPGNSFTLAATQISVTGLFANIYWSPASFLSSTLTLSNTVTPASSPGNSVSITYSVLLQPLYGNCPFQQTFNVTYYDPPIPSIAPILPLCANTPSYQVIVSPPGGQFFSDAQVNINSGIILPPVSSPGFKQINYVTTMGVCSRTASSSFVINTPPPVPTATLQNICAGTTTTLIIGGPNINSWNGIQGSTLVVTPLTNTSYVAVSYQAQTGCSNSVAVVVNVLPNPSLTISGTGTVCENAPVTVSVSGADTYTWMNNSNQAATTFTAGAGVNNFSVSGSYTNGNCTSSATGTVMTVPNPTLTVIGNTVLCKGNPVTLTASGADAYSWGGNAGSQTYTGILDSTMQVTLVGTNEGMCRDTLIILLKAEACTGISENNLLTFQIYPNPAATDITINAEAEGTIDIFELTGKLVLNAGFKKGITVIPVSTVAEGEYLVKCTSDKKSSTRRLVIKR